MTNPTTIWKKLSWVLQGATVFGLGAALLVSIDNYEWNEDVLSLSFWQLIWISLCMMVGGGVLFASNTNKQYLHKILLKSVGVLVGIYFIAIGLKAIVDQYIVVKYLYFGGYQATVQGFVLIILGVAFGLYIIKGYFLKEYGAWSVLITVTLIGVGVSREFSWTLIPLFLALGLLINSKQAYTKWLRRTEDRTSLAVYLGQIGVATVILLAIFNAGIRRLLPLLIVPGAYLLMNKFAREHFIFTAQSGSPRGSSPASDSNLDGS